MELLTLAILLAAVFFANFYGSGVGGASLLILPAMFLSGVPANIAVATNRLHRLFASGVSLAKFLRNVRVEMKNLLLYLAVTALGSILGALVVINLDEAVLKLSISAILLVLGLFFLIKKDIGLKEQKGKGVKQAWAFSSAALFVIAVYRVVIGSAGGTFARMYFVLKEGFSFLQAATYSSAISTAGNTFATVVFIAAGIIDYQLAFYMIIVGVFGSYLGAHFAIKKGNKFVRQLFLLLVIITSLKLIAGVLFGI